MAPFHAAQQQLLTVRDFLRFAVSQFQAARLSFGHGTTNAYDEAAYLILHTLHLPLDQLEPFLDARLIDTEREAVLAMLLRRIQTRTPAAYLTQEAWLAGHAFFVDERVIVPRSFIAELLGTQLVPWVPNPEDIHTALDLCTGSGCLAILMAHAFPHAQIEAVDLSKDALAVAAQNVSAYGLPDRITLTHSDLFTALAGRRFDLIISNPPYVRADQMPDLPLEYQHEPTMALVSGSDGLDATRTILHHAADYLNPNGLLVVEVGGRRTALEEAFPELAFTWVDHDNEEMSDSGVFLLTRETLDAVYSPDAH